MFSLGFWDSWFVFSVPLQGRLATKELVRLRREFNHFPQFDGALDRSYSALQFFFSALVSSSNAMHRSIGSLFAGKVENIHRDL
jgi:hypothetical protein